jgi:hypothetical protein
MLIVTEPEEHITRDHTTGFQSQPFSPDTQPLTLLRLSLRVIIVLGKMLVKIRFRPCPTLLWYAAKHKSAFYANMIQQIGMNSLQSDIPVSFKIPVIMVETIAPSSKRIAPRGAQTGTMPMLRFGRNKMLEVMQQISGMKGRFLTEETGIYAMTLTPPRASGRAAGRRLARPLVAKLDGNTNDKPMKGAIKHYEQTHRLRADRRETRLPGAR